MFVFLVFSAACAQPQENERAWMETAKQKAEDKMNSSSEFIKRQLEKGLKPNRLIEEKSPYLLQHAFNPVDWFPWGEEAFEKARVTGKPIFLSIGYSTCHWCHVMEHESFENSAIAAIMNAHFINIKVDREERPDVDRVYMAAVQALTGAGGWPMSVFLTPELKPFYGGTYFPPDDRFGRPGFPALLTRINQAWQDKNADILTSADEITAALKQRQVAPAKADSLSTAALDEVYEIFRRSYDARLGGFSGAPKFPRPAIFDFLFQYGARTENKQAHEMALTTLRKMHAGGMYDHLGGGFHRYSVDEHWRVPHFEKMLYDQGQLVNSYLDAFQASGDSGYAEIAEDVLQYVLRDMTSPDGGFYSAEDADSAPDPQNPDHKIEGAFYLWEIKEIEGILGQEHAEIFTYVFGLESGGNTISDPHGDFGTTNVFYLAQPLDSAASRFQKAEDELFRILREGREKLVAVRNTRLRPLRDDKIVTAWNGLMISAFARAGMILNNEEYENAAVRAADFIIANLMDRESGRLLRRFRNGEARYPAHLDDYAYLIVGLLDVYEAGAEIRFLQRAEKLAEIMLENFYDENEQNFYDSAPESQELLFRTKELYDGAEPSGASMAMLGLLRLGHMTANQEFLSVAENTAHTSISWLQQSPSAFPKVATAIDFAMSKGKQIVIAGAKDAPDTQKLLAGIHKSYLPNRVIIYADGEEGQNWLGQKSEAVAAMTALDGKPTVYVCENFACELPTSDVDVLRKLLSK